MTKGGINLYIEQEKHKLDQIAARNIRVSRQTRSFFEVKLRHPRRKTIEGKDVIRDKNESRINLHVLYSQTVLITAGPSVTI